MRIRPLGSPQQPPQAERGDDDPVGAIVELIMHFVDRLFQNQHARHLALASHQKKRDPACLEHCSVRTARGDSAAERTKNDLLGLTHDGGEVFGAFETFRIKFIDIFCPGRPSGEPTTHRDHLQAAD